MLLAHLGPWCRGKGHALKMNNESSVESVSIFLYDTCAQTENIFFKNFDYIEVMINLLQVKDIPRLLNNEMR
jgi:hypothetical protein